MKILVITPYYTPNIVGGAEISSQLIAETMQRIGHDVSVLTLAEKDNIECINGVTIYRYSHSPLINVWKFVLEGKIQTFKMKIKSNYYSVFSHKKVVNEYIFFLRDKHYDIAIMNTNEECFCRASLWKCLSELKIPSILTIRDPLLIEKKLFRIDISNLYRVVIQKQLKSISSFAAPSQYMLNLYNEAGLSIPSGTVIYNAVDVEYRNPESKKKRIIYAGALVEKKGVKTLLKAFKILKSNYNVMDFELCYVGKGELSEYLVNHEGVTVIPWIERSKLYDLIHESYVLVLPSEWPEAFGRTVIEAVFNGTLAIGSTAGALPEVFNYNKELLFDAGNSVELAIRIKQIIEFPMEKYNTYVKNLQLKWDKYTLKNYVNDWNKKINDVVNENA